MLIGLYMESKRRMKNEVYPQRYSIQEYIVRLQKYAYQELADYDIIGEWKRIPSFAQVVLSDTGPFEIYCNLKVQRWPEPALYGLLAHELSHISLRKVRSSESGADEDVISRGLGAYLALERIFVGKYLDHSVKYRHDKYIGYDEIRKMLGEDEIRQLDLLLVRLKLIPPPKN